MSQLTTPDTGIDQPGISYFVALQFSEEVARNLVQQAEAIAKAVGAGVYVSPLPSLHVSIMDFIDLKIDPEAFGFVHKDAFWQERSQQFLEAFYEVVATIAPFTITFDQIAVSPAAIIVKGHDQGQVQGIRTKLMERIGDKRLPGTKQPPDIIHSTIARFTQPVPLAKAVAAAAAPQMHLVQSVEAFCVFRQSRMHVLEAEKIAEVTLV